MTVYTGDVDNAGTDANVHIVLYGEKGNSGQPHKLDNSKNNFERNSVDEFFVEIPKPLGKLTHIHIAQDKSGIASAWFLDRVVVNDESSGTSYTFPWQRWIDSDAPECDILEGAEAPPPKMAADPSKSDDQLAVRTTQSPSRGLLIVIL